MPMPADVMEQDVLVAARERLKDVGARGVDHHEDAISRKPHEREKSGTMS